jgi:hypothetical protein
MANTCVERGHDCEHQDEYFDGSWGLHSLRRYRRRPSTTRALRGAAVRLARCATLITPCEPMRHTRSALPTLPHWHALGAVQHPQARSHCRKSKPEVPEWSGCSSNHYQRHRMPSGRDGA